MKKTNRILTIILAVAIVLTLIIPAAATSWKEAKLFYRDIKITLDGKEVRPTTVNGDYVEPFIIDGTTYLPVRGISSALGLDVDWNDSTNTVILKSQLEQPSTNKKEYKIGETWRVAGQWELTITGVRETTERNPYSDKKPAAVYIVDYTYKNLGWEESYSDGIFFGLDDTIVDSAGYMGYGYPNSVTNYPQETPVGAICVAQDVIAVDHPGTFRLTITKYDTNDNRQSATFVVDTP